MYSKVAFQRKCKSKKKSTLKRQMIENHSASINTSDLHSRATLRRRKANSILVAKCTEEVKESEKQNVKFQKKKKKLFT